MIDHINIKPYANSNIQFGEEDIWIDAVENVTEKFRAQKVNTNLYYLLRIQTGKENICIDGKTYSAKQDDLILLTPYNSKEAFSSFGGLTGDLISFSDGFYAVSQLHQHFLLDTLATYDTPLFSGEGTMDDEKQLITLIFRECKSIIGEQAIERKLLNWRIIRTLISNLLLFLQRRHSENLIKNTFEQSNARSIVLAFSKLIDEHYRNQASIAFYIKELSTTSSSLNNSCKKILGIPPKEVMQRKVVTEAKRLLMNHDNSIQEIGYYLGFSDPSNFNKFFQKRTGITPRQFRQNKFDFPKTTTLEIPS
ncbi:MAG: hypothetical protein DI598_16835 [Pseudopedobacter saltans]|uniref:HTH araC/xylS-type domain-containing protein n=1 Tax=Pseudopedobacter saltans TaxID=151895 RepID=A0A2W5ELW1_9SPHI|nr:MAG: hypothetical protein DI598_16835 [Pseudopedobacter saltans]